MRKWVKILQHCIVGKYKEHCIQISKLKTIVFFVKEHYCALGLESKKLYFTHDNSTSSLFVE